MGEPRNVLSRWMAEFQNFTIDVIYDRRKDGLARAFGAFLWVLSHLFALLVSIRSRLYRYGILKANHLGCMVIVVGNLTVGGTGKTPVVEKLARSLRDRGRRVAILSRGYKSKKEAVYRKWWRWITHTEPSKPREVSNGKEVLLDAHVAGDEPYMLAKNLPGVVVLTDKDRVKAGLFAIKNYGCDTLILDDGFQYYKLKDHLQVLLVDKTNPFGNGHMLPRGLLREPVSHLARASYVFLTKSTGEPDPALEATVRTYKPDADPIECTHAPQFLQQVGGDACKLPLEALEGKRVNVFSAIAVPESFESYIEKLGAAIHRRYRFLDHHRFHDWELGQIADQAKAEGVEFLVTTEKDAVRLPKDWKPDIPVYYLRVEIKILAGVDDFEAAVSRICFPKQKMAATRPPMRSVPVAPATEEQA